MESNTEYVARIYGIPLPYHSVGLFLENEQEKNPVVYWALAKAIYQRASIEGDPKPACMFYEAAVAYFDAATKLSGAILSQSSKDLLAQESQSCGESFKKMRLRLTESPRPTILRVETVAPDGSGGRRVDTPFCAACAFPVKDLYIKELGRDWHFPCFLLRSVCAHCGKSLVLGNGDYVRREKAIFHKDCCREATSGLSCMVRKDNSRFDGSLTLETRYVHPGGAIVMHAVFNSNPVSTQGGLSGMVRPSVVVLKLKMVERTKEGTGGGTGKGTGMTKRVTKTIVQQATTFGGILPVKKNKSGKYHINGDTSVEVPGNTPPSHLKDMYMSREYKLSVKIKFKGVHLPIKRWFEIIVTNKMDK